MNSKDLHHGNMDSSFMFELPCFEEDDGKLGTFESDTIPEFDVKRVIYIYDVPEGKDRANHACMNASLIFIAIAGLVKLSIECEGIFQEYRLDNKNHAVFVPPSSWIRAYDFSQDAVLLGLSDRQYKYCNYVNDYKEYKKLIGEKNR